MFDNNNPYILRTEEVQGAQCYYVSFEDGQGTLCETEVSEAVYFEFLQFSRHRRNLRRWDERHREQSELTDEALYRRAACTPKILEDATLDKLRDEGLREAVAQLSELQRRRFVLYHEFGFTYAQIAEREGCTKRAVKFSVDLAEERVREKLKNF